MLCTKLFLILVIYDDNFRNIFPLLECYFILSEYIIHHLIASPHVEWRDAEMWKCNNFLWPFLLCISLFAQALSAHYPMPSFPPHPTLQVKCWTREKEIRGKLLD